MPYSVICQQCFILSCCIWLQDLKLETCGLCPLALGYSTPNSASSRMCRGLVDSRTWNWNGVCPRTWVQYPQQCFIKFTYAAWLGGDLRGMPSHWVRDAQVLHKVHVCSVAWLNDTPRLETGYALASWIRCFIDKTCMHHVPAFLPLDFGRMTRNLFFLLFASVPIKRDEETCSKCAPSEIGHGLRHL